VSSSTRELILRDWARRSTAAILDYLDYESEWEVYHAEFSAFGTPHFKLVRKDGLRISDDIEVTTEMIAYVEEWYAETH
jgi:hypothetical protein